MSEERFRLADRGWANEIERGLSDNPRNLCLVSPFIKAGPVRRLIGRVDPTKLRVITRYNLNDFDCGVSDIAALADLLDAGAAVRGIQGLHSKGYVFGDRRCVVTSANFTESGLLRNREFGFISTDSAVIAECQDYCERLWLAGRRNLDFDTLQAWRTLLKEARLARLPTKAEGLPDFGEKGVDQVERSDGGSNAAFIKFFGSAHTRALRSMTVVDEVIRSGSHWACTYSKRPRQVDDGDMMFMARMVRSPDDYMIYGEAVGRRHVDDEDTASPADLALRGWKKDWPYYIRVHRPRFMNGTLANGVSMNRLMDELGSDAFFVTQFNAANGSGNTAPRRALMQQPAVKLSSGAAEWVRRELDRAYVVHGHIDLADTRLDWPG